MARIRTVKVEFWTDEAILSVSPLARLMLIGMFNFADDEGRMDDSPIQIKARIFPVDGDIGPVQVQGLLTELANARIINRYSCEKNHNYIEIKNFRKHQKIDRPNPSIIPAPSRALVEHSSNGSEESPPEGNGMEGNYIVPSSIEEGTRDILPNVTSPPPKKEAKVKADFEQWWKAYPARRKAGKPKVYHKWCQLRLNKKLLPLPAMLEVLEKQKRSKDWLKDGGEFIPAPHPYLNQFKFLDESLPIGAPTVGDLYPKPKKEVTADNAHEFADPACEVCGGKGMFFNPGDGLRPPMRIRCDCTNPKPKEGEPT
jgi:hypothetical protein